MLFGRDKSVISRHIANVFKEGELDTEATVAKNATTAADGKTRLIRGFPGKQGKTFDARLSLDEHFNLVFVFPRKK